MDQNPTTFSEIGRIGKGQSWLFVIVFVSLVANFAFDWKRRIDFAKESQSIHVEVHKAIESVKNQAEDWLRRVHITLSDNKELINSLEQGYASLLQANKALFEHVTKLQEEESKPGQVTAKESIDTKGSDLSQIPSMQNFLSIPIEELLKQFKDHSKDPKVFNMYSPLSMESPDKWQTDKLLPALEEEYKVSLTHEERELLTQAIDSYRDLGQAGWANYRANLALAKIQRVETEDYELAHSDGTFESDPNIDPETIFASTLEGKKRFRWSSTEHPSEYQSYLVAQYVPLVMVKDIRGRLERKVGRQ